MVLLTSFSDYGVSDLRRQTTISPTSVSHRQRYVRPQLPADYGPSDLLHRLQSFQTPSPNNGLSDLCRQSTTVLPTSFTNYDPFDNLHPTTVNVIEQRSDIQSQIGHTSLVDSLSLFYTVSSVGQVGSNRQNNNQFEFQTKNGQESISIVHSNHSQIALDLPLIYWSCHSQKILNRPLISHGGGRSQEEEEGRAQAKKRRKSSSATRLLLDHRRTSPCLKVTPNFRPSAD
ncbi:hypothetical protein M5K25_025793 [Dendrobium thyrsiflorum]|uniref:Uncharacterized protein n=1 Tax=Dendrobium thyrsiflorum TaxID=117978 RepID=A0ABD0UA90_DENTH